MAELFYIPASNVWEFQFFHILPILIFILFFIIIIILEVDVKWHLVVVLICICLTVNDVEVFSYTHWAFVCHLWRSIFVHLYVAFSLLPSFKNSSCKLDTKPLSDKWWVYFLPLFPCSFWKYNWIYTHILISPHPAEKEACYTQSCPLIFFFFNLIFFKLTIIWKSFRIST